MAFTKRSNEYKCKLYGEEVTLIYKRATPEQEAQFFDAMTGYDKNSKELVNQYSFACAEFSNELIQEIEGATMIDAGGTERKFHSQITPDDITYLSGGTCKHWYDLIPVAIKIDAMTALYPRVEADPKK
jgi:hypothetical protein